MFPADADNIRKSLYVLARRGKVVGVRSAPSFSKEGKRINPGALGGEAKN